MHYIVTQDKGIVFGYARAQGRRLPLLPPFLLSVRHRIAAPLLSSSISFALHRVDVELWSSFSLSFSKNSS